MTKGRHACGRSITYKVHDPLSNEAKRSEVKIQVSRISLKQSEIRNLLSGAAYNGTRMDTIWEFRQVYVNLNVVTDYLPLVDLTM